MLTKSALKKHVFFFIIFHLCFHSMSGDMCGDMYASPIPTSIFIRKFMEIQTSWISSQVWNLEAQDGPSVFVLFFSKFFLCRDNRVGKLALAQRLTLSVPRTSAASCWPHVGSVSLLSPCSRWDFYELKRSFSALA